MCNYILSQKDSRLVAAGQGERRGPVQRRSGEGSSVYCVSSFGSCLFTHVLPGQTCHTNAWHEILFKIYKLDVPFHMAPRAEDFSCCSSAWIR